MPVNSVAENVFGTMGTVCWCIQLIPQVWKSWREKSTYGLSPYLMLIWALAALPLGVYNIAESVNIPLMVQPQLFGFLACTCWVQCFYYDQHFSKTRTLSIFLGFLAIFAGLEAGFVFAVRYGLAQGNNRPYQFFGVMTAILLFAGLIPQYYEIWKLKEVRGVSMLFMLVDGLGGLFSFLSLVFKPTLDPLLSFSYVSVVVLDSGIMILQLILNPIARRRRVREAAANPTSAPLAEPPATGLPEETREKPTSEVPHGPYSTTIAQASGRADSEDGISLQSVHAIPSTAGNQTATASVESFNHNPPV
ncbi:hypothetical protein CALVIDRAFT_559393 [Calocera viscosa TUFC12733]|uniref:PQ-loop-domain-containing protein n=1 Tax=Calocera viscosa (strain TUFC12733) TaxID=1330018 RepID=A0A167S4Y4_CALVF|nr:hypothetical protein CALVIDRAFT_559393 [Calocera viscosa TUFC12733]